MIAKGESAVAMQRARGKYRKAITAVHGAETAGDLGIRLASLRKEAKHVEARLIAEFHRLGIESLETETGRFTMVGEVNASFIDVKSLKELLRNQLMFTPGQIEHAIIKCSKPAYRAEHVRVYPAKWETYG